MKLYFAHFLLFGLLAAPLAAQSEPTECPIDKKICELEAQVVELQALASALQVCSANAVVDLTDCTEDLDCAAASVTSSVSGATGCPIAAAANACNEAFAPVANVVVEGCSSVQTVGAASCTASAVASTVGGEDCGECNALKAACSGSKAATIGNAPSACEAAPACAATAASVIAGANQSCEKTAAAVVAGKAAGCEKAAAASVIAGANQGCAKAAAAAAASVIAGKSGCCEKAAAASVIAGAPTSCEKAAETINFQFETGAQNVTLVPSECDLLPFTSDSVIFVNAQDCTLEAGQQQGVSLFFTPQEPACSASKAAPVAQVATEKACCSDVPSQVVGREITFAPGSNDAVGDFLVAYSPSESGCADAQAASVIEYVAPNVGSWTPAKVSGEGCGCCDKCGAGAEKKIEKRVIFNGPADVDHGRLQGHATNLDQSGAGVWVLEGGNAFTFDEKGKGNHQVIVVKKMGGEHGDNAELHEILMNQLKGQLGRGDGNQELEVSFEIDGFGDLHQDHDVIIEEKVVQLPKTKAKAKASSRDKELAARIKKLEKHLKELEEMLEDLEDEIDG
ncbi:MAG TPA: hypothetical protein VGA34_13690 [Alteraurantiacibacter sp.]